MRKLKFHEQKLLKKTNLYSWKREDGARENKILRRYYIQDRDDYLKYNKICGYITKLVSELRKLPLDSKLRKILTEGIMNKLYDMNIISSKIGLDVIEHISASSFCRRRLAVVVFQLKFVENLKDAVTFIEQGHIRIGPDIVKNPAYHITRDLEDHITWAEGSKIKTIVRKFNNNLDDFELQGN